MLKESGKHFTGENLPASNVDPSSIILTSDLGTRSITETQIHLSKKVNSQKWFRTYNWQLNIEHSVFKTHLDYDAIGIPEQRLPHRRSAKDFLNCQCSTGKAS